MPVSEEAAAKPSELLSQSFPARAMTTLVNLPRSAKQLILIVADATVLAFCVWFALALRYGDLDIPGFWAHWSLYVVVPIMTAALWWFMGLYRTLLRSMSLNVITLVAAGGAFGAVALLVVDFFFFNINIPRSTPFIFAVLAAAGVGLLRIVLKIAFDYFQVTASVRRRVAIYGAGTVGMQTASALARAPEYKPVIFIDDNRALRKSVVAGLRVYPFKHLERVLASYAIDEIVVTNPAILTNRGDELVRIAAEFDAPVKLAPRFADLLGDATGDELRELRIEDLLGRDPVQPLPDLLGQIKGKRVLVTGAAGSIGSELCRQIQANGASRLVCFDSHEYGLYALDRELATLGGDNIERQFKLGSITDGERVRDLMKRYEIDLVYHAAAYKHVPMVEENVTAATRNNVMGTRTVLEAAVATGAERFVLVSTDKAVRPTNVMGATKRMAELVVQGQHQRSPTGGTTVCMVRFGNVLGSSGSVIPLFRRQIEAGGPITLTNRKVTRYFMTIPEAAELVLQAGFIAKGGEVFVLDMGEPVRMLDLARMMIQLSGRRVQETPGDNGIEIQEVGLRPGEKLYEELLIDADVTGTSHPKIMSANERSLKGETLEVVLAELEQHISAGETDAIRALLTSYADLTLETGAKPVPVVLSSGGTERQPGARLSR